MHRPRHTAITAVAVLAGMLSVGLAAPLTFASQVDPPASATQVATAATHHPAPTPPGAAARATTAPPTTTMRFIAVETFSSPPTKTGAIYQNYVDVRNGVNVSQSILSCVAGATSINCSAATADAKGILDTQFQINTANGDATGTVTGGSGGYSGATGTLSAHPVPAGEALTITYSNG